MTPSHEYRFTKPRQRASVACHGCRDRRTRCVVPAGSIACSHCSETGQQCVIKQDDRRRKPISKAYVSVLQKRILDLETALGNTDLQQPLATQDIPSVVSKPIQYTIDDAQERLDGGKRKASVCSRSLKITTPQNDPSTKGYPSFDPQLGRCQFGSSTGPLYTRWKGWICPAPESDNCNARQDVRSRTRRVLAALGPETQKELMDLFWCHYNSVIRIVDRAGFEEGLYCGGNSYSGFLHICILAVGQRFADRKHTGMARRATASNGSSLHQEAKDMLGYEMQHPDGIPSIVGLLLLADLEGGCGHDQIGWLYVGVAIRICSDIGLHQTSTHSHLSLRESEIRLTTLRACVLYDQYWSLFLGRSPTLKPEGLEANHDLRADRQSQNETECWETEIYEALMELMELGGHIGAILERTQSDMPYVSRQRYFDLAALDRELTTWYSQLRPSLRHTVENARAAPTSFLHLHQQYYSIMISLHSELGMNDFDCLSGTSDNAGSHQVTSLSRLTCITCAGQMAQIFWQQRQRFKTSHMFSTGLQHAGSAASILVMALKSPHRPGSWKTIKTYLDCIFATLKEMTRTYPAAERMVRVLSTIISELSEPGGFPPPECPEHHGTFASESDQETNNMSMEPVISITPNDNLIGDTAEQQIEPNSGLDRPIQPGGSDFDPWTPLSLPSLPGDLETIFPQAADINLSALDVEMISPSLNSSEQREELHGSCSLPHTLGLSEGGNDPLSSCLTDAVGSLETGSYTCFKEPTEWADTGINMYDQYSNLLGITEHG